MTGSVNGTATWVGLPAQPLRSRVKVRHVTFLVFANLRLW
ncbi:hypothetical protein B6A09_1790 [Saccharomyces cerevisiae synthetic construct]|uniref:Putative uncharacterized protein YBR223W-A n=2 Tax=Saccharomyces cerevisiae TaxID=4932 RepID=YB223_YEAST|nr:RecName: Full=Putative uncharacterized protein YBR223W-A [Saccharomyces cerevisiae S288C]AAL79248.1 unknown [Saccharomyces cerevisiae]ARB02033.1 hypothetical protein B6A09_1790 [Saccharomyces cerevisiae synthetic construct]CBK39300.1 EC1118_1B15_3983p [Saccharomyces cerevisiae EC1118]KZV13309.1 hypothetical protein WN66_00500 [Saccharomyces cerevisiae]WNV72126.1 hypothetical protein O6U65_0373 [Saccharomyces cerevisiae synthetic construct]